MKIGMKHYGTPQHWGLLYSDVYVNQTKNGETQKWAIPCQPVIGGVETMNKKDLYKYISAFVMGDAGVYYSGKHCRLVTSSINKDYILWKKSILEELTHVNYHTVLDKRGNRKLLHVLTTRTNPLYTKVRKQVYTDRYRGLSPHYLKLLDWETLAILYMDDGSCYQDKRCNATPKVTINTKRLSYGDSLLLKNTIKKRLNIEFNVNRQKQYYLLALRSKDYDIFKQEISPYILESFKYKLL